MITTIDHAGITAGDVCSAQEDFTKRALRIEECLKLPKGWNLTLCLSKVGFEIYIMAPCEIVSFETGATIATRIVAKLNRIIPSISFTDKQEFEAIIRELKRKIRRHR